MSSTMRDIGAEDDFRLRKTTEGNSWRNIGERQSLGGIRERNKAATSMANYDDLEFSTKNSLATTQNKLKQLMKAKNQSGQLSRE